MKEVGTVVSEMEDLIDSEDYIFEEGGKDRYCKVCRTLPIPKNSKSGICPDCAANQRIQDLMGN